MLRYYVHKILCSEPGGSFFFFSSRRRHTSWPRDWSSDVCSSDLSDSEGKCERVTVGSLDVDELRASHGEVGLEQVVVEDGGPDEHCQDRDGERAGEQNDQLSDHQRSEEHTSELQSRGHLVCRLLL